MKIDINKNPDKNNTEFNLKEIASYFKKSFFRQPLLFASGNVIEGYFHNRDSAILKNMVELKETDDSALNDFANNEIESLRYLKGFIDPIRKAHTDHYTNMIGHEEPSVYPNVLLSTLPSYSDYLPYGETTVNDSNSINQKNINANTQKIAINEISQKMAFLKDQSLYAKGVK